MRNIAVLAILAFMPIIAVGKSGGMEKENYLIATSVNNSDIGDSLSFLGMARFPAAKYGGISLLAHTSEFNGKKNYIDSSSKGLRLDVFLRKYDLGIIQVGYGYSEKEHDFLSSTDTHTIDTHSLNGTYYIDKFDVSLSFLTGENDDGDSFDISNFGAGYFVNKNLQTRILIGGMDADGNNTIAISYQPEIFGNTAAVSASYDDTKLDNSFRFSVEYYFNTKVSFVDRVRKY